MLQSNGRFGCRKDLIAMDFDRVITERYSVRKFKDEPLKQSDIEKILIAGHKAPTGCNYQPQRILVLRLTRVEPITVSLDAFYCLACAYFCKATALLQISRFAFQKKATERNSST